MSFHQPSAWLLLLLLALPLLWWRRSRGRGRAAIAFSSVAPLEAAGSSWALRLRWIVPALRGAALALLIVCVARPQKANEHARVITEGIAIQLVVDRSESMLAEDFRIEGRPVTRLEAVKAVVREFVEGGSRLPGRPDDLVGLVSFATWADSACPLTLDHGHLVETVRRTQVSPDENDRATAIGDAIALGVERIRSLEDRPDLDSDHTIKSRVMILLTDGESNAGDIDPLTAAEMAAAFGIRIYTIGAGTNRGEAPMRTIDPRSKRAVVTMIPVRIDEATLTEIADITGGEYFRATDSRTLEDVYARIDELERTEIEQRRYTEYAELSVESVALGGIPMPPLLTVVFVLLAAEIVLANTRFRRIP